MPKVVDHQLRRNEISAIAARLIASGGIEAATLREIARHSGYSKGVIEHYFDNKEQVISAALDWSNHCYQLRADKLTRNISGIKALEKRLQASLPLTATIADEWKVRLIYWSMAAIHSDLRKQQKKRFNYAIQQFENDINCAIAAGELPAHLNATTAARRLVNMTTGISTAALFNPSHNSKAFLLQEIKQLVQQLLNDNELDNN
ncbi:TetR/AcrR family transcriptional regulator [Oceanicoccus sp. KOV_DT_Chl]|uniref:TetR/AcrR family transcriptional regulator n=1 Tax=Oceanicoccus sp. KOV_DT_Chl TaxID=1904639 RepID=UPI000C7A9594|nr:TetR/AcrR family transcriptional regulator [Oceanicoccus sp. KOV_DT_Chl]